MLANGFENKLRRKRFALLAELLAPLPRPIRILDVGGAMGFWQILDCDRLGEIHVTMMNVYAQENLPPNFSAVVGDARCLKAFRREDYDVVISNSVIGHVGSFENQKQMADEIRRVGRRYFVQTPNQCFPVDWRTLKPFFHFLPARHQAWWLHHFPVANFGRMASYPEALHWASRVRNHTYREIKRLFPDSNIVGEKLFGFTKSFMVFRGFESSSPPKQ